jgi:predicted DCC family thiol-disulfide oxidoreductase YuxK
MTTTESDRITNDLLHAGPERSGAPATRSAGADRQEKNFSAWSSVTSEITDDTVDGSRGILFYDGACGVCRGLMRRFGPRLARRGYRLMPLQSPHATALTGRGTGELMEEAHLLTADGRLLRGVDTVVHIGCSCPITWPLAWLATRVPGVKPVLRCGYRVFARNRYGISRACGLDRAPDTTPSRRGRLAPYIGIALALSVGPIVPAWVWMWTIAFSVFIACKWWMWGRVDDRPGIVRTLAYFFATPSMDARGFIGAVGSAKPQAAGEWWYAIRNVAAGAAMVWIAARSCGGRSPDARDLDRDDCAILMLHFGAFHLLSLATRSEPLMNRPTRAATLAQFWGRCWNRGFSTPARELVFRAADPPRYSATAATAVYSRFPGSCTTW